jgi:hypothetical protein
MTSPESRKPSRREQKKMAEAAPFRVAYDAAIAIHPHGLLNAERFGRYKLSGETKYKLRGALHPIDITSHTSTSEAITHSIMTIDNRTSGTQKTGTLFLSHDGVIRYVDKERTIRIGESEEDTKNQAEAEFEDRRFRAEAGLFTASDNEVLQHMRDLQGLLGDQWPADVTIPADDGLIGPPTDATKQLFGTVTEKLASHTVQMKSTWEEEGKTYLLTTEDGDFVQKSKVRLTQVAHTPSAEGLDEKTVTSWEFSGSGRTEVLQYTGTWPQYGLLHSDVEGDEIYAESKARRTGRLGRYKDAWRKASPVQEQLGIAILQNRAKALQQEAGIEVVSEKNSVEPLDPLQKPVTLVHVSDEQDKKEHLTAWHDAIVHILDSQPQGKVAVVTEGSTGTQEYADFITEQVESGVSPTHALREAYFTFAYPDEHGRDASIVARGVRRIQEPFDFLSQAARVLSKIEKKYPGRIQWTPEWNTYAVSEEGRSLQTIPTPQVTDETGLKAYKERLEREVAFQRAREEQIKEIITDTLADDTIIGAVGLVSAVDTRIGHRLRDDGYQNLSRVFPGMQDGVHVYSPRDTLLRKKLMDPYAPVTDNEIQLTEEAERITELYNVPPLFSGVQNRGSVYKNAYLRAHKSIRNQQEDHQSEEPLESPTQGREVPETIFDAQDLPLKDQAKQIEWDARDEPNGPEKTL